MVVRFLVNEVHGGWMPDDTRLGGTEEAVVEWARIFSKKYEVQVFSNFMAGEPFEFRGATYYPNDQYIEKVGESPGATINIMCYRVDVIEPTIYVTTETDAFRLDLSQFHKVVWPTEWARDNVEVNNDTVIVPYGYHPGRIYPWEKVNKQCLYASSPDRGLEDLQIVWPEVVKAHPDAHLYVTYGGHLETPNTTNVGSVSEGEMDKLYKTSDIWLHPCNGGEMYGISGIKAQAAGAIPVYYPTMALSETVQAGIKCEGPRDMTKKLISLLDDQDKKAVIREQLSRLSLPSWEQSAKELESVILESWTKS
jgi:glycosyltransferase involved in cell wall biosynthesis